MHLTTPVSPVPATAGDDAREDFSMVLGGPLYQLFLRMRVARPHLELLTRRIIVLAAIAWVPLLILSLVFGHAWRSAEGKLPFLHDVDAHVRFLVALPLLLYAEVLVHARMKPIVSQFLERGIVPPDQRAAFDEIGRSSMRLRNSVWVELGLVAFVLTLGHLLWRKQLALQAPTWFADHADGAMRLTAPGLYYAFVSVSIFQFILFRWYFRLFVWCRFLHRVSRLNLRLIPTHPDGAAGLGFLQGSAFALMPVLIAHTALLAGLIANRIFHEGARLPMFKLEIIAAVLFLLLLVLGPLVVFTPRLLACRRAGLREYGRLASRYVQEFDAKWVRGAVPPGEPLLGSADVQSLADLGNSFEVVRDMRVFPFGRPAVVRMAVWILLPLAPLLLTMIPLDQLLDRGLQMLL